MKKLQNFFWPLLATLYLVSRLINLKIIPIFTDEAIYSYWAQIALHDPVNRFVSMEDGKQPLFIWFGAILQKFVSDPLIAMRLVSTIAGGFSLVGIYLLTKQLFDQKTAKISALLYIILPFTLLYDRMGLYDSLLTMLGIYSLYFAVRIAQKPRLELAFINGIILGLGQITKSSANIFLYLLPATLIFFDLKKKEIKNRLIEWTIATGITAFLSILIFNYLRVSPLFYMVGRKNLEFIRSYSEVLRNPFAHFVGNFHSITTWYLDYNGILLCLVALSVAILGICKFNKSIILLCIYILFPFSIELFFNKVLYPRFALFYLPYFIILVSFGINKILEFKKIPILISLIFIIISLFNPIRSSYFLLTNPPKAQITESDKNQYINDWPAGYGVAEITQLLKEQSKDHDIYVATEGTFGLLPFAFKVYFYATPNPEIVGYWPLNDIPQQVLEKAKSKKTYIVYNENQSIPDHPGNPHMKFIAKYQKGSGAKYMRIYEILP